MSCRVCGVTSSGGQYCVACGQPMVPAMATAVASSPQARPERSTWLAFQEIRLLACPRCGAPNSAARWQCARCGETFNERADDDRQTETAPTASQAPPTQPEPAPWLGLITAVAGVAVVAVAVVMLASRGVGPFGADGDGGVQSPMTRAGIIEVVTSGAPASADVQRGLVDGQATTAWRLEGEPAKQWVELRLERAVEIDHLLVWNGDQRDAETFAATNRVKQVMISFPDAGRKYTAVFPDVGAHFRVDMIDPPLAQRIRIQIESVYGDADVTALTDIEALVNAPSPVTSP